MRRFIGIVLLLAAVAQLSFRGMQRVRYEMPMWDFVNPYAAARAWINGTDPYFRPNVIAAWQQTRFLADRNWTHWASVYPPTSLALIAPLAALPPRLAMTIWFALTIALLGLSLMAIVNLLRWDRRDPRTLLLIGATLFAAPTQFALMSGQLSMPAISMCILAFWCAMRNRPVFAGVLIGIACALKPQVAGIFLLFYVLMRQWKTTFSAVAIGGLIALGSIAAMQITHPTWFADWTNNIAATTATGAVNDYSWSGQFRDHIIDLKMLLVSWIHDPMLLRAAIAIITLALLAWLARAFPRTRALALEAELTTHNTQLTTNNPRPTTHDPRPPTHTDVVALATLCAIFLLPVYHRVYDAAVLVLAFAWALAALDDVKRRRYAIMMLIALSPLLIPFDLAHMLSRRAPRLAEITQTAWWQTWLAPHYAWGLLAIALASLITLSHETAPQRAGAGAGAPIKPARESDTVDLDVAHPIPEDDDEDIALAH